MRSRASAITIACLPSGLKYRLYGSSTRTERPGLPVRGSIGVSMLPLLSLTHSVLRSHEGTTCCGCAGTGKLLTTLNVRGSRTSTELLPRLGTYTSGRAVRAAPESIEAPVRAYTSKREAAAPEVFSPPRGEGDGEGDAIGDVDATDVPVAGCEEQAPRRTAASTATAKA